ncbi:MAG: hypothetical protein QW279_03030, partial [Candidatus Jordarchaeaceae archaeon]
MTNRNCEEEWKFEFIKSRINTRENSTLMFSTVAVSLSLVFLSLIIGQENSTIIDLTSLCLNVSQQPNSYGITALYLICQNWSAIRSILFVVGIIITLSGISYREVTIFLTDREDHNLLRRC